MNQIINETFDQYVEACREYIKAGRVDLTNNPLAERIINANLPFALYPQNGLNTHAKYPYGALLIHGLFDSPFTMQEISSSLQSSGIPSKAILLPGHGTKPEDLLTISYHDWVENVRFGVESMLKEVDKLILIGYSTGAALAVYHALEDERIAGMVLIAPAIKIKAPIRVIKAVQQIKALFGQDRNWILKAIEDDYVKYRSISYNATLQVTLLAKQNTIKHARQSLDCPMLMIISDADETISSRHAIKFFRATGNMQSQMLLYSAKQPRHPDPRIEVRNAKAELHIKHFSHIALPFSASNAHYGLNGDFPFAPKLNEPYVYGAYNRVTVKMYHLLYRYGLIKQPRRGLTYNPDFNFMMDTICNFIPEC